MQKQWSEVDKYLIENLVPTDAVLAQVLENNHRAGLPRMMSPLIRAAAGAVCPYGGGEIHS